MKGRPLADRAGNGLGLSAEPDRGGKNNVGQCRIRLGEP